MRGTRWIRRSCSRLPARQSSKEFPPPGGTIWALDTQLGGTRGTNKGGSLGRRQEGGRYTEAQPAEDLVQHGGEEVGVDTSSARGARGRRRRGQGGSRCREGRQVG